MHPIPSLLVLAALAAGALGPARAEPAARPGAPAPEAPEVYAGPGDVGAGTLLLRGAGGHEAAPRLDTRVAITVTGLIARARVSQRFRNPTDAWQEGIYVFPLPADAGIDRLRMRIGERVVEGRIEERQAAERTYERARASGGKASLVEQERPNVFTTSVANIGPGEEVTVEIEYQHLVALTDERFAIRVPLVVGPRFIPGTTEVAGFAGTGWARNTDAVPDAARITPPVRDPAEGARNPVAIEVDLDLGAPLAGIRSPHHAIAVQAAEGFRHRVVLDGAAVPADRDFVLEWGLAAADAPRAAFFREAGDGAEYGLVVVMPPARGRGAVLRRETILVVDTSGSMGGQSIRQAKAALELALDRLQPGDRFNVIQFNSRTSALFGSPQPVATGSLARGRDYVRSLRADGGTVMAPAVAAALRGKGANYDVRQVVFLTDGSVGNEAELFDLIRAELGDSRLFTVGIGSAPNAHFMRRAARLGRGTHTFVGAAEEVQGKMEALLEKLASPVLHGIAVDWGAGAPVEAWPERVPDLYRGEPLVLTVKAPRLPARVRIAGDLSGARWSADLALSGGPERPGIGVLWARRKIAALMDLPARGGEGSEADAVRDAITETALAHGLVSRYTSLVAVDVTPSRPDGAPLERRNVPVNLPAGWDYAKVFGRLPGTATPAPLWLLLGTVLCLAALALQGVRSGQIPGTPARDRTP